MAKLKLGDKIHNVGHRSDQPIISVYTYNKNNNFVIGRNRFFSKNVIWFKKGILTSDLITALYGD